jgi:hypothetical protein
MRFIFGQGSDHEVCKLLWADEEQIECIIGLRTYFQPQKPWDLPLALEIAMALIKMSPMP